MEAYGAVLNIVVPIFFVLFFIEAGVAAWRGEKVIRGLDSVSSFSSGVTNVVKDILGLSVSILTYGWLVKQLAVFQVGESFWAYAVAFVAIDFSGYWSHRWNHEINFFWNQHIVHHSSEEFNLSCALRQEVSSLINFFTFLLIPAAIFGVPVKVLATIGPIHLFLQYWYHTQLIGKMGWLENVIVTPSHHRVHHAINPEYMDKNYGQVFIFWDRWFGTFQEELADVPPVYGVKRPVKTWNPFRINFQHLWLILTDAWRAQNWLDKLRVFYKPTGWRPADVAEKFPVFAIGDPKTQVKYDVPASKAFVAWAWVQLFFNYFLLVYFFSHVAKIGSPGIFWYGGFIGLSVFAYTELMDKKRHAVWLEILKSGLGLYWIFASGGDWFGARGHVGEWYVWVVAFFMVASASAVLFLAKTEIYGNQKPGGQQLVRPT